MRLRKMKNVFEVSKEMSQSPGTLFQEEPLCSLSGSILTEFIYNSNKHRCLAKKHIQNSKLKRRSRNANSREEL